MRPSAPALLAFSLLLLSPSNAHVVLTSPQPRVDSDYLYSFEQEGPNLCSAWTEPMSCNHFCGHPADDPNSPVTELEVGVPVDIKWRATIAHYPYRYRIVLNRMGDGDNHFDDNDNLLATVENADAADPGNRGYQGSFTTSVTIPPSYLEKCSDPANPCALHLWDLYSFVSCANVVLVGDPIEMPLQPVDDSELEDFPGNFGGSASEALNMTKPEEAANVTLPNAPETGGPPEKDEQGEDGDSQGVDTPQNTNVEVMKFTLVDTDTKEESDLSDGDTLDAGTNLSIRAYTNPDVVDNLVFSNAETGEAIQREGRAPYMLAGDSRGVVIPAEILMEPGTLVLKGTPTYGGVVGTPLTITLTLTGDAAVAKSDGQRALRGKILDDLNNDVVLR